MERWASEVARLGGELGPQPAADLLPTPATSLASVTVEPADDNDPDPDSAAAADALRRVLGRTPRPWCGPALDLALASLDAT